MNTTIWKCLVTFFMITCSLCADPSENEIVSVLEKYIILNNPNVLDDMLPEERRERVEEFNKYYRELSGYLGKEEVFYFMRLSKLENVTAFVHDSAVLRVPIEYLEHYEEYNDEEKRQIGEFIWTHKQAGDLRLRHLRRIENPEVIEYLEEQYKAEGGPGTGRGYKIRKMLDEIYERSHSDDPEVEKVEQKTGAVAAEEPEQLESAVKPEESKQVSKENQLHEDTSNGSRWLWILAGLVLLSALGFVLSRRKKSSRKS
ncbi:MAG: hypothetical protein ACLFTU_06065 [Puniceicoccaceae bacterium]